MRDCRDPESASGSSDRQKLQKKQDMPITNLRLEVVLATTSQGDWRGLIVDIKFSLQMLDTDFRES
jgi:hypothetical protein